MLTVLLRIVFLVGGLVLLLDASLPARTESLKVDLHSSRTVYNHHHGMGSHIGDTKYTLDFVGGRMSSCEVGYAAYSSLHDGDTVNIQETRLLKICLLISKDGEVINSGKYWRLIEMLFGCILIAWGIGWLNLNNENNYDFDFDFF